MKQICIKLISIGFLFLVAVPLLYSTVMLVQQKIIHHQRIERLEKTLLQTITISKDEIIWVKANKEILVNGKYFDIKLFKSHGNSIELIGYFDTKEDLLVKQLKGLMKSNDDMSPFNQLTVKFFLSQIYLLQPSIILENNWLQISRLYFTHDEKASNFPHRLTTPPPKS